MLSIYEIGRNGDDGNFFREMYIRNLYFYNIIATHIMWVCIVQGVKTQRRWRSFNRGVVVNAL